jgi:uncharacterized membrane protein YeaQ/YmgE (transglycosylase-associated protein family)
MKNAILRFLVSRAGGVLTPIVAGLVGAGVAKLAAFDAVLAGTVDQVAITGFIVALILSVVNYFTNAVQTDGVKAIQKDLGKVAIDGVPGTKTQARAELVARRGHPAK